MATAAGEEQLRHEPSPEPPVRDAPSNSTPDPAPTSTDTESPATEGPAKSITVEASAEPEHEDQEEATEGEDASDAAAGETPRMTHDSMVTVRLSEPPSLTLDTTVGPGPGGHVDLLDAHSPVDGTPIDETAVADADKDAAADSSDEEPGDTESRASTASLGARDATMHTLQAELAGSGDDSPDDADEVNWEKLEQTEDEQAKDDETDNSTTLLLQRLEQENAKLATNPKTVKVKVADESASASTTSARPRPPSMAQLRQMVTRPPSPNLRYSMLPPPPMTDLEFWGALVKDYQQTAARLPTLLSNKIHKGIPPPLRGVVWQSMSGARDGVLEEQYDRLSCESSPYELLIGKDLGRSFPGVEMFRDPEGDGQRMLGRVLKAFSLYDTKIGYCQGLAFLVGPLLMHMPDKQAFCVLVRLMERYDLRTCFLPDLSGLHVRIFQFRELLKSNLPALSNHFDELQVDPAYVSQWFLSFFAVTCPLPMLFRIYDVIFAEGASETLMRVALSLMRKNEARLLACDELEDALQLLLSRGLWDCYHYDADVFVEDFVSLTGEVSRENLTQLERGYRDSLITVANTTRTSDITKAATRFLGRIWATSTSAPKGTTLTPGHSAPRRPLSMLRRSTSKQSLASTLNSMEASSASVVSSVSTDASTISRDSSNAEDGSSRESTPVGNKTMAASSKTPDDRYLHSQIEDLLTAMGELQRTQALMANQLQREREERQEDHRTVRPLLDMLKRQGPKPDEEEPAEAEEAAESSEPQDSDGAEESSEASLSQLIEQAEERFGQDQGKRRSSMLHSKVQLREELAQARDQLANSMSLAQDFNQRIQDLDAEVSTLKDQVRESHAQVHSLNQDKHRLERQLQATRVHATNARSKSGTRDQEPQRSNNGGLRELKLARSKSSPSQAAAEFGKRVSSLPTRRESAVSMNWVGTPATPATPVTPTSPGGELMVPPANDYEVLLLELAQCKTAEAVARQEAEEARQKLESLRKAYGLAPGDTPPPSTGSETAAASAMGLFGRLTGQGSTSGAWAATPAHETPAKSPAPKPAVSSPSGSSTSGGFWGWRR